MNPKLAYPFLNLTKDFQELARPLIEYLGVHDFGLKRIYKDGSAFFLTTNQDLLSDYYNRKYIIEIPPQAAQKTKLYCPWKQLVHRDKKFLKAVSYYHNCFNRGNGFYIIRNYQNYVEIYGLATTIDNESADYKFLTELEPIEKFIEYFNFAGKTIIQSAEQARIRPPPSYSPKNDHNAQNEKLQRFYETIGVGRARIVCKNQTNIILTPRESQCLRALAQGRSVKQIAKFLKITPRTVDFHLSSIKHKTGYHYNSDLATCYWQHNSVSTTDL